MNHDPNDLSPEGSGAAGPANHPAAEFEAEAAELERARIESARARPRFHAMLVERTTLSRAQAAIRDRQSLGLQGFRPLLAAFAEWPDREVLADALGVPRDAFTDVLVGEMPALDLQPRLVVRIGQRLGLGYDEFLNRALYDFEHGGRSDGPIRSPGVVRQLGELWKAEAGAQVDPAGDTSDP